MVEVGSLLATGWLVWSAALIPRLRERSLGSLLAEVVGYTLLAWAWSVVVAIALYAIVPLEDRSDMLPNVFRTAATAVWFGPAMILLLAFSPASLLAALVLVVYTSRLLYAQWTPAIAANLPPRIYTAHQPGAFADCELPRGFVWQERMPALGVALCLQAGTIAIAVHYPLLGAAWICAGTALLTTFSMAAGAAEAGRPPSLPKSLVGILATVLLASLLVLGRGGSSSFGIATGSSSGDRPSLIETARAVLRQVFYGETPGERGNSPPAPPQQPKNSAETGASGGFPGVILWPDVKPVVTLVAPMPELGGNPFQGRPVQPLSIPFAGEYWVFRWPFARPPATSFFTHGTPSEMAFSSTDHRALQMEAHQKLDTPIDLRCCREIQIEVLNADRFPGTVGVELVLLSNQAVHFGSVSLGQAAVTSRPDLSQDPVTAVHEMLDFKVPPRPVIDQFDEFKVVFHRAGVRADKSAKVSIERFVLLPR